MSDPRDVSGIWYGRWGTEHPAIYPNRFIALLSESGGAIDGTTSEPEAPGLAGILGATIAGQRAGANVQWTKSYDGAGRLSHVVTYQGRVNGHGTEIRGRWQLRGGYSGSFVMEREKFDVSELEEETAVGRTLEEMQRA